MIDLRPYQSDLIARTRAALGRHRAVLIHAPTGSGKTALAAYMLGNTRAKGKRGWFIAHRDFLLEQTALTFTKVGIPYGFIAAGRPEYRHEPLQIVSVGTLGRRLKRYQPPDVVVWDECHHIAAATYDRIYHWASGALHIGLTATPCRLDGKGLGKYFGEIVPGPDTGALIDEGWLSPFKAFAPGVPDLSAVHTMAGDYNRNELAQVVDSDQIIGGLVSHYRHLAAGFRAVYYAVSIRHSEHISSVFNANGIPARHLDSESSTQERLDAARKFAAGEIKVLTNVDLFGEGYDLAAQAQADVSVEAVGLARPTQSLALHLQQIGRALRPSAGKSSAVILDHAGNILRHGLPTDEREWLLTGITKRPKDATAPVRMCKQCFAVFTLAQKECPNCGAPVEKQPREVVEVDGALTEVQPRKWDRERASAVGFDDLVRIERERGYKPGWAKHVYAARQRKVEAQAREYLR